MLQIQTLSGKNATELADLFNYCFQEYQIPVRLTIDAIEHMIQRESIVLEHSYECLVDGVPVGLCWIGIRGEKTWCGGFGIGPEYRGKGYGKELMSYCIEQLKKHGYKILLLECIDTNYRALNMYKSLGLKITGSLYNFKNPTPTPLSTDGVNYQLISGSEVDVLSHWDQLHQINKSWQGDLPSLLYHIQQMEIELLTDKREIIGMMLYRDTDRGIIIHDLASKGDNKKLYQIMLAELHKREKPITYQFISGASTVVELLRELGYEQFIDQVQMSIDLS